MKQISENVLWVLFDKHTAPMSKRLYSDQEEYNMLPDCHCAEKDKEIAEKDKKIARLKKWHKRDTEIIKNNRRAYQEERQKVADLEGALEEIYSKATKALSEPNDTKELIEICTLIEALNGKEGE